MLRKIRSYLKSNKALSGAPLILSVFSGLLLYAAHPPFSWYITGWVALVPLFFAVRELDLRDAFFSGMIAFSVFFALHIHWLFRVTVPGALILIFILSLFGGVFALAASHVQTRSMDLFILPFVWTILEYVRTHILTGFPWGSLAFSQWNNLIMIQISDLTGSWGVGFLMVMTSCAFFAVLSRAPRRIAYLAVCGFFLAASFTYGSARIESEELYTDEGPEVRLVQGNIPQHLKWEPDYAGEIVRIYRSLSFDEKTHPPGADMVVWPETAWPYLVVSEDVAHLGVKARRMGSALLAGVVYGKDDRYHNSAMLFSSTGKLKALYHKLHLVPFGEYVPFEDRIGFLREHIDKPIGDFTPGDEHVLFNLTSERERHLSEDSFVREIGFHRFGVLICYEDIFPHIARNFVKQGADFLVNMTNDAWFGKTAASWQHMSASVLRAVENRVSVVRSANTGISCFISPTGRIYSIVEQEGESVFVRGISQDRVQISRMGSFYTEYGDVFVFFSFFMLLLLAGTETLRRRNSAEQREG